jgi:hypothetical protein
MSTRIEPPQEPTRAAHLAALEIEALRLENQWLRDQLDIAERLAEHREGYVDLLAERPTPPHLRLVGRPGVSA